MTYITVLDYSIGTITVYTSKDELEEDEIEELISDEHDLGDIYYMVSDELNLNIKPI